MVQTIQAQTITLADLQRQFSLQWVDDAQSFPEWQTDLPEISEFQQRQLGNIRAGFINFLHHQPLLENIVRMVVLDPLLFVGEFYLAPFYVRSEDPIEIAVAAEDVVIRGRIDTLIVRDQLWVTVIESKQAAFSVEMGLAQTLAYMFANPQQNRPTYGLITTGGTFLFLKLYADQGWKYNTSSIFVTRNPGDLEQVLRILKRLSQAA
ncbi:MAG: restriction endonuclease subunit R [Cyanobacteria bacterium P01_G01_bin.54]